MFGALMLAAALSASAPDPLEQSLDRYRAVESYQVTIRSQHADGEEHLRYYFQRPGRVRMEFVRPHAGAVLIYAPASGRVYLWPFGAGRFPRLALSPGNPLVRSARGQRVDRSDVGALLDNARLLREGGTLSDLGEEMLEGRPVRHLEVSGANGFAVAGVHRYQLWLDAATLFPVKVVSRDARDTVIESVQMEDAVLNPALPPALFDPDRQ